MFFLRVFGADGLGLWTMNAPPKHYSEAPSTLADDVISLQRALPRKRGLAIPMLPLQLNGGCMLIAIGMQRRFMTTFDVYSMSYVYQRVRGKEGKSVVADTRPSTHHVQMPATFPFNRKKVPRTSPGPTVHQSHHQRPGPPPALFRKSPQVTPSHPKSPQVIDHSS